MIGKLFVSLQTVAIIGLIFHVNNLRSQISQQSTPICDCNGSTSTLNTGECNAQTNKESTGIQLDKYWNDTDVLRKTGQIFCGNKLSELLMAPMVQEALDFDNTSWSTTQYVLEPAITFLSVPLLDDKQIFSNSIKDKLIDFGAVAVPALVPQHLCIDATKKSHELILKADYPFGNIMESEFRKDLPVEVAPEFVRIIEHVLGYIGLPLVELIGNDSELVEFSVMNSYPGSGQQHFHPDSNIGSVEDLIDPIRLYSIFVYLDEVTENKAALDVWPGTHTHYQFLDQEEEEYLTSVPGVRMAVPMGSIVIFDSRTLHRGTANTSPFVRPTFYFSFKQNGKAIEGPTYSIRNSLKHKLTLGSIMKDGLDVGDHSKDERLQAKKCDVAIQEKCQFELQGQNDCLKKCLHAVKQSCWEGKVEKFCQQGIFAKNYEHVFSWGKI